MKTAFGWVSNLGVLYRKNRAPMVAVAVVILLMLPAIAMAKGPVVSATETWYDYLVKLVFGPRNLS